ncbi:MAG: Biotin synthesis protein BioC [Labilithrix sp.]|nr:Biotin synthesis protein BioC [Labilithrix sp.]
MKSTPARFLGPEDAAVFETFVVPRYLSLFAERLIDMIVPGQDARVCHLQCRTGYPDRLLLERLPNAHVYGCDNSEHAIELARAKAKTIPRFVYDYRVIEGQTTPFPAGAFSHGMTLHPLAAPAERRRILEELARIVAPRGQALVAMPLRGSFGEIADLLRECALKNELTELTNAVEAAVQLRPTDELFKRELESVGFEYVDVDVRTRTLRFENGRQLFEDPATRLMLLPEFRVNLHMPDDRPFTYVREAIDKYWSDGEFELTVNVGVVSGRRKA